MEVRRINPEGGVVREIIDLRRRVRSQETRASGNIVVRETLTTEDPETGVQTIIGLLPDGTYGFQPFVGDITPPPVATAPTATVQPGLVTVRWDGKFVDNATKPRDFEQVNVIGHKIVDGATVSSQQLGLIRNANTASYINEGVIAEDETWQFSLESEDFNGNKAGLSARSATITMIGIMSPALVEDKLQELRDEDTALSDRADETQDALADAQALADALLAKGQNLAINGDFDAPLVAGKPVTGWPTLTLSSVETNPSVARTGTQYLRAAPTSSTAFAFTNDVTSANGRTYRAEYWVKLGQTAAVTDATATVGFYFVTTKLDGTLNTSPQADTTVPVASLTTTGWTKVTKDYTVTQDVSKIKFGPRLTGNGNVYYIDSFKVTDVTEALAAQQKADSAFANAQQAAEAAGNAATSADSKNKNWYQTGAPAGISHKDGDTWFDTDDDNRIYVWNATTKQWVDMRDKAIAAAANIATGAKATADGKNTSYWGTTQPTGGTYKDGDLFFNTAEGNKMYLYKAGVGFVGFQDAAIAAANQAATGAQTTASGKNSNYYASSAPTTGTYRDGDTWFDTANGNRVNIRQGSSWVTIQDAAIAAASAAATGAQATADGKNKNYYNATKPTGGTYKDGDQWFDTGNGNKLYLWKAANNDWVAFQDAAIASLNTAVTAAKASADGKTTTYYQPAQPSGGTYIKGDIWIDTDDNYKMYMYPGTGTTWVSVQDSNAALTAANGKNKSTMSGTAPSSPATGDIWIDTASGNQIKTWSGTAWSDARDTSIAAAAAAATAAQGSANGKNTVYYQTTMPTGGTYRAGDTWFDTDDGNKVYVHNGTTFVATPFGTNAIANQAITNAQIFDATIQAAKIGSVDAGTITVGTLDANRIAASTIGVEKLLVGSMDNLVSNPLFKSVDGSNTAAGWSGASAGPGSDWDTSVVYPGSDRSYRMQQQTAGSSNMTMYGPQSNWIPVIAGESYRVGSWIMLTGAAPLSGSTPLAQQVYFYDINKTLLATGGNVRAGAAADNALYNTWQLASGLVKAPAGAVYMRPRFTAYMTNGATPTTAKVYIGTTNAYRAADGSLIVDGSIVAGSAIIADGAIGNAQITDATITTAKISSIDAGKIQSGFIDSQRIDAGSISANKLAVGDFANLLDDPSFEAGPVKSPWVVTGGAAIQTDSGRNNTMVLRSNSGRTAAIVGTLNNVRLATNDSFIFRMWLYINVTTTSAGQIKVLGQYKTKAGTVVNTATLLSVPSGTTSGWRMYESSPAVKITDTSIESMTVQLSVDTAYTGIAIFDDLEVRRQTGATLIEQGSITTGHVTSTGLDAGAITAGTITGLQIQAGAITADKMLLTSFDNLVENGGFEYGLTGWASATNWTLDTTNGRVTPNCLKVTGITARTFGPSTNAYVPIEAGDQDAYRLSGWVKTTATSGDVAELCMYYYDANKGFISNSNYVIPTASTDSTWRFFSKLFVPPAGIAYFRVRINSTMTNAADIMYFDDVSVNKAVGADLIVDGAIKTQHMTSGTIDAGVITSGSIKALQLSGKSITADKLLISSTDNVIQEGNFVGGGIHWTLASDQVPNTGWTWSATAGRNSTPAMNVANTAVKQESWNAVPTSYTNGVPTKTRYEYTTDGNNAFRISAWVKSTVTVPVSGAMVAVQFKTSAGVVSYAFVPYTVPGATPGTLVAATIPANTWTEITGMITTPADNVSIAFGVQSAATLTSGTLTWDSVTATRASNGELIVDGTILTQHLKAGSIDAGVLSANSITAAQIGAGAVTAEKLTVGIGSNLIPDPGFLNPAITKLRNDNSYGTTATNATTGNLDWTVTATTNSYFRPLGVTQSATVLKDWIPVLPGEKYAFSVDITLATGMTGDVRITGRTKDGVSTTPAFSTLVNFPSLVEGQQQVTYFAEVPAGIYWMLPEIRVSGATGVVNIAPNSLSLRLRAVGELIVDGAITTDKIKAGAVDAGKLAAGAVTAVAVGAKSITTDKLVVSSTNNLLIEPDFGLNGISWTTGTNMTINATAGRGSTPALRFTGTTAAQNSYNLVAKNPDVTNKIAVDSDNRFRASFWVKSTEALPVNAVKLAMRRYTTGTAQTAITMVGNDAVLVPNVWTQFQAVSPALASNVIALDFYLIVDNLTTGGITDIDAVSVTRAADGKLIVDGEVTATKLETNLVLATKIIAGSETGTHAAMEPTGFKVYAADPGGGSPVEVVRLGVAATDDYFAITKSNGDLAASISQDGVVSALDVNASRGLFYKGDELQALLDDKPRGVVAAAYRDTSSAVNGGTTNGDIPYLRLEAFMEVGRVYKISTSPLRISRDAGASVTVGIKYNSTGNATTPALATVSSGNLTQSIVWDEANAPMMQELFALTTGSSRWVSFLIWLGAVGGNAGFRPAAGYPARLIIEDVGPNRNTIGSGVSVDGNATPPAAKNTYTKQYFASGSSSYKGDGTVYSFDAGRMYQGLSPAGYGNLKSLAYFPSMTGDLSGAIVNNIRVYFMFDHWYYNSGGTARITLHGQSGLPATFPTTYGTPAVSSGGWPKPGDRWVTIPSSYYGGFVNGTYKGVALEGDGTYGTYGIAQRPVIEISYTK